MSTVPTPFSSEHEYAWEVATLFPEQGEWSEDAYLDLSDRASRRIELSDGRLEFLQMPTEIHEALIQFLFMALYQFVDREKIGKVYSSGIRVRVRPRTVRLPDVLFLHKDHFAARHNRVWDAADLVMEVVSGDLKDRQRDYQEKLKDYAEAKVGEYWIVDPEQRRVTIHQLKNDGYALKKEFTQGDQALSILLPGFVVDVAALFAVIDEIPE
jgi:Uma2 family endonuclease